MTIEEAANALFWWLVQQAGSAFLAAVQGAEIGVCCYRIGVQQLEPTEQRRIFEVRPLDVPDCYEVKEVSQ